MKCPKCGFTSFDFLENCKKCGVDLQEHKVKFGLRSIIFPGFQTEEAAPSLLETAGEEILDAAAADDSSEFGFDFMSDDDESVEEPVFEADSGFEEDSAFLFDDETPVASSVASSSEELAEVAVEDLAEGLTDDLDEEAAEDVAEDLTEGLTDDLDEEAPEDVAEDVAEAPADDLAEGLTDDVAAEAAKDVAEDEFAIDFDDWDSELEEESDKPPRVEEGPSDPFEFRESADHQRTPETAIDSAEVLNGDPAEFAEPLLLDDEPGMAPSAEIDQQPLSGRLTSVNPVLPVQSAGEAYPKFGDSSRQQPDDVTVDTVGEEPDPSAGPGQDPTVESAQSELFFASGAQTDDGPEQSDPVAAAAPAEADDASREFALDPGPSGPSFSSWLSSDPLEEVYPVPPLTARIASCLTDLLILAVIFVLFLAVGELTVPSPEGGLLPSLATLLDLAIPYFLVLFALCFGYFTLFHFLTGQTPGKMLFKLRVESITGSPLLFSQAFLRSAGGLLSLLAAGIGYLVALFNKQGRGWNDQLAGSRIVPQFEDQIDEEDLTPLES